MQSPPYEELVRLEPRLAELEERIAAVRDPGDTAWFCSNFVWLPLNADLKDLVGVARRKPLADGVAAGEEQRRAAEQALQSSFSYETAYRHLSQLLPPCRGCGCRAFAPYQAEQVDEVERGELR